MSKGFRESFDEGLGATRWAFFKSLPFMLVVTLIFLAVSAVISTLYMLGHTVVERKVFENSFQRTAGLKERLATDEAVLVGLRAQLSNPNLDQNTRTNLEAQAAAIRVRIDTTRRLMK